MIKTHSRSSLDMAAGLRLRSKLWNPEAYLHGHINTDTQFELAQLEIVPFQYFGSNWWTMEGLNAPQDSRCTDASSTGKTNESSCWPTLCRLAQCTKSSAFRGTGDVPIERPP
jgi:hypothetical protein